MVETIGSAAEGHPALNLTTEEKRVYGQLLKEADPDGFGAVSGDVAVKFFEKTKLPPDVLGQIWQIADTENRGFLTPAGFGVVLRLIGHAQAGRAPTNTLAPQPAPLPKFDDPQQSQPVAPTIPPIQAQYSGTPSSPTQTGPTPIRVPALTPEKVAEYSSLFEKSGAENGSLSGLVAKQIFERARLPNEVLGRIWNLADTQGRGALDVIEFVIAMHLLASYKSGAMRGVPSTLPPGLYDAAARRPPPRMAVPARPASASGPVPGVAPQYTGSFNARPQSPVVRQQAGTPLSAQSTGDAWAITPADKARFDQIFASLDKQGLGFINGEQAVTFFGNARLPEEVLAQIWDLADINSEGRLNKDEFAVAMYLIRQQRGTRDGRGNLPPSLPPSLIPPSMRRQVIPPSQPTAPAFENATITQPRSAAEDLFGLDVLAPTQPTQPQQPAQPAPAQTPQQTGFTDPSTFGTPTSPQAPPAAATAAAASIFKPFQPSSSFGQSIIPQSTGSPAPGQSRSVQPVLESEDLLGDGDANVSSKLTNETAELGNLSNQVGNLSKQMTQLQGNRSQAEAELAQNSHQKRAFETRLTQLRAAYEKEVQEFKTLQEQLTTSRNETKRLQQDMAMIEGSHADLRTQHQQLRTAFESDQQENLSLKEKMRQVNAEADQFKPQIEKLKSDARQQKGLVAINKKQLATNEAERDRLKAEVSQTQREIEQATKEAEEASKHITTSKSEIEQTSAQIETLRRTLQEAHDRAQASKKEADEVARQAETSKKELEEVRATPIPSAPAHASTNESRNLPIASPTPSTVSNPFMRREGSAVFSPPMGSPEPANDHSAFDSIFGPSFGSATSAAPATSFGNDTPTRHQEPFDEGDMYAGTTPSSSKLPEVVEPPAPPSAKQITSDALPLRTPMERTESMNSSVRVMPPASRLSPAETPRALTPSTSTPGTDKNANDSFELAGPDEEQLSVQESIPHPADQATPSSEIPGAFPTADTPRTGTPSQSVNPTAVAVGAGAATVAVGAGLAAAVSHHEDSAPKATESTPSASGAGAANNFDEYFGGPAHQRTPSEQVKDFDAAFASMNSGAPAANGTAKAANKEFPDIQELDDDDSSVYSEEAPLGFDDDFGGAKPSTSTTADGKKPEVASAVPNQLLARPQFESASSNAGSLPDITQQSSPPTYGESVPADNAAHFPREYKGLLPERGDPTSPTLPSAAGSAEPAAISSTTGPAPAYGPEIPKPHEEAPAPPPATSAAKPPAFDFDSAFAGMGPAQVNEDESDDEAVFGSRRDQMAEFDPTFDSPLQSRAGTVASMAHSPSTTHDAVTNGGPPTATNNFYSFGDDNTTTKSVPQANNNSNTTAAAVSHDWDALFAPLSQPSALGSTSGAGTSETTQISPDAAARTSATELSGASTPVPTSMAQTSVPASSKLNVVRPQPGRALSTGTEHDDPILKRLTAMGWSRDESLSALEKFDYNIDKAADYLTFRS